VARVSRSCGVSSSYFVLENLPFPVVHQCSWYHRRLRWLVLFFFNRVWSGLYHIGLMAFLRVSAVLFDALVVAGLVGTMVSASQDTGPGEIVFWNWLNIPSAWSNICFLLLMSEAIIPLSQSLADDIAQPRRYVWEYIPQMKSMVVFIWKHS
jgi:hypothetical protein